MTQITFKITFTESLLGTAPNDPEIYENYVSSKAPDALTVAEEIDAVGVEGYVEKGITVFPREKDGSPFLWDYQINGFFKDSCGMLSRLTGKDPETGKKKKAVNESGKLMAYKKIIDGLIFVEPRKIPLVFDGYIGLCQRPLRAQTAQGERVALSISEEIPAGATATFTVLCLDDSHAAAVREWMEYGRLRGIGQWRNSGKGRFTTEEVG